MCHYYHPEQWQTVKDQSRWSGAVRVAALEAKLASPDPKLDKEGQEMEARAQEKEIKFLNRSPTAAGLPCKPTLAPTHSPHSLRHNLTFSQHIVRRCF